MANTLPPLPRSDSKALEWNVYDSFYQVKAGDFWKDNQLIKEEVKDFKQCAHKFEVKPGGAKCTKCHFGLIGHLDIRDGDLFVNGSKVEF